MAVAACELALYQTSPPLGTYQMRAFTLCAIVSVALLSGCSTQASTSESSGGETDKTFKPTQYSVADFYANKSFSGSSFSPDRKKILVASNSSGIWNAYAVPVAGGDLVALTSSTTNSIFPLSYFPNDERILYRSDEGGNERSHIYVRSPDGTVKDVTPGKSLTANCAGTAWAIIFRRAP